MTFEVRIDGAEIVFPCGTGETVLEAAERAGFAIPYSCRKGVCQTCEGQLVAGEGEARGRGTMRAPQAALFCQLRPHTDLTVAPVRIARAEPPARKTFAATVYSTTRAAPDVTVLRLRFPIGRRAPFRAGQYLRVLLQDGDSRNFSLANPPQDNDGAELHVRDVPGGRFSQGMLGRMGKGDAVAVELPFGQFGLSGSDDVPAVLVATGTGFAPMQSIIEDQIRRRAARPIHLYWGARGRADLYRAERIERWLQRAPWLSYTPVLSDPEPDWTGRTGLVHRAVLEDHPRMEACEVYACGNPLMVAAAQDVFISHAGLPPAAFYSDAFTASGDGAGNAA